MGCWVSGCYIGCILYADDMVLMSANVCDLQKMIDLCVDELCNIDMILNAPYCDLAQGIQNLVPKCAYKVP